MGKKGLKYYNRELSWLARLVDAFFVWGILPLAGVVYGSGWHNSHILAATIALLSFAFFAEHVGLYRSWRSNPLRDEFAAILVAWLLVIVVLLALGYATKTTHLYSRVELAMWFVGVVISLIAWRTLLRLMLRKLRACGWNTRTVAIAGINRVSGMVAETVNDAPWMGLDLVGFYDDRRKCRDDGVFPDDLNNQGTFQDLIDDVHERKVDIVYVTLPLTAEKPVQNLVASLADTTASVYIIPDFFLFQVLQGRWLHLGSLPVVSVYETPFYGVDGWFKRVEDLLLCLLILPFIAIPMLFIGLAVKLTSPGPAIFIQHRYGLDGRKFEIWKFRTMHVMENGDEIEQARVNDPRVTPLGAILRRFSLDELPQFLNVLTGNMSIVGPRPHAIAHNEYYRKKVNSYMIRHKVKPGITGWAQIHGYRGETSRLNDMADRIEHDLWYIRNWSPLLDMKIIFKTVPACIRENGA